MRLARRKTLCLTPLALSLCLAYPPAKAETTDRTLANITVTGNADSGGLSRSAKAEQANLNRIAGGSNLALPQEEARLATIKDALGYQPGVVIQEFFGATDQPRLNIRGSGIQSNPMNRGLTLLQDGLPLNEADGSFVIGTLEARDAAMISVRRGANAITPGTTTLGGEIDFQSLTGHDESGRVRLEAGSFGRQAVQVSGGFTAGEWDTHVGVTQDRYDGYRRHSNSERQSLRANLGYRSGKLENRTYLSWTDLDFRIPGTLPKDRIQSDPRGIMGDGNTPQDKALNYYLRDPHRQTSQLRLANRTTWGDADTRHELGIYAQNTDDEFANGLYATQTDSRTLGGQWLSTGRTEVLDWRLGAAFSNSDMTRDLHSTDPKTGKALKRFGHFDLDATNSNLSAGADWHFARDWTLIGDLKWSSVKRDARNIDNGASLAQHWQYTTPRLGALWQWSPDLRIFANLSRSQEAPTYWEIVNGSVAAGNPATTSTELTRLRVQKARTLEIGASGNFGQQADDPRWQATIYRSELTDELISTTDANGIKVGTFNYRDGTRHQGVELGLAGAWRVTTGSAFEYRLAYTYSDFRFKGGEYAGNRIAGIPRHLLDAELRYRYQGWRFGPNIRWLAADTPTDHANTPGVEQDAYILWGFKADYRWQKWSAFIQAENLADKRHASSYAIRNRAKASDPGYLPGNGRSIGIGMTYVF